MELRQYLFLLRRWAWLLALGLVVGGVGAYVFSLYQPMVFQTATKVMVMRSPEERGTEYSSLNDYQLTKTYSQLMVTEPVLHGLGEKLGSEVDPKQISARHLPDSLIIELTVKDGDPTRAAQIANTLWSCSSSPCF